MRIKKLFFSPGPKGDRAYRKCSVNILSDKASWRVGDMKQYFVLLSLTEKMRS